MPEKFVLKNEVREKLFTKLQSEPQFRELVKKDWKKALTEIGIEPAAVAKGMISRNEIQSLPGQAAAWTIEIVISGRFPNREVVQLNDAVAFDVR